ncbi:MAG: hypothetical protein IH813_04170 [Thaumarchaeota archaeon]|nr:hypothetical protein [Nitrososphaerota archaeon]
MVETPGVLEMIIRQVTAYENILKAIIQQLNNPSPRYKKSTIQKRHAKYERIIDTFERKGRDIEAWAKRKNLSFTAVILFDLVEKARTLLKQRIEENNERPDK